MKTIFDRTTLGGFELRNRVWRSATWMAMADYNGYVTDKIVELYRGYAEGGIGAIITGITGVAEEDMRLDGIMLFTDDSYVDGHRRITEAVHGAGGKIYLQTAMISSCRAGADGRMRPVEIDDWTRGDIARIVACFGDAARRAELAGYDGVQIHAAHGFFLNRFISPAFNHRDDGYGGDAARRARILLDVLADMRAKTSAGFSVIMKINGSDEMARGMQVEDFLVASELMAKAGVDAVEVSANNTSHQFVRAGEDEAYFRGFAEALKARCDVPVILVGGHRSLERMNGLLNETDIEYLSMSRPFVREPGLLARWESGDARPSACVSCNACYGTPDHACIYALRRGME